MEMILGAGPMFSTSEGSRVVRGIAAFALGLSVWGTPLVSFAQGAPPPNWQQPPLPAGGQPPPPNWQQPPPPPNWQQPPPPAGGQPPPPPNWQQPPPPAGAQPYPYPYPYPPPYPYAQPGASPYGPYGYPPPGAYYQGERPETLPYEEGQPTPPGYRPVETARKGLVITGAVLFGVFYLGSVLIGIQDIDSNNAPYGALFVPVIGPFIVAGAGNFAGSGSGILGSSEAAYVFDGLIQAGGGAMLLIGALAKKKVFMREDLTATLKPDVFVGPGSIGMKMRF